MQDEAIVNILKYGKAKPNLIDKAIRSVIGNGYLVNRESTQFWQALFSYSRASKTQMLEEGYAKNVNIYSVIKTISQKASLAPWAIYRVKDRKAYSKLKSVQKAQQSNYTVHGAIREKVLKEQALEPYESHYLNDIINNPNPQQGQSEYLENILGYKLATGDLYEYAEFSKRGKDIVNFWVLPSDKVTILTDDYGTFPMRERGYQLNVGGKIINLSPNEVLHSKYWNPHFNGDGNHLYGFSPLESLWLTTLQDNNAREAAIEQLKNRGVRGIFTIESDKIQEYGQFAEVKGSLHTEWQQDSKNYKDKIMPMFGKGQWHNVGLSIKDLAILETSKLTANDIYNAYGVSNVLFNNSESSTYDNFKQAKKELITRCVLPLLYNLRDARNKKLVPNGDWNKSDEKIVIDFDQTIFTELFDDVWEMAKDMRTVGAYTDNEIRIATNYEMINNPLMDEVWKRSGDIPMSLINNNNNTDNNDKSSIGY